MRRPWSSPMPQVSTRSSGNTVLEELYDRVADDFVTNSPKICDAWAIDCPHHGESAILNEETLSSGYTPICKSYAWPCRGYCSIYLCKLPRTVSWGEYARALHLVLSGFGKGIDVDFGSRNLVGIGHSMGASAMSALAFSVCVIVVF